MDILEHMGTRRLRNEAATCLIAGLALVSLTGVCYILHLNLATAGLLYVVVVVLVSRTGGLVSSIVASIIAALCLAHLAPPAYSFRVNDRFDDVAIAAFLVISIVIARLVSRLRRLTEEALSSVDRRLIDAEERERSRIAREFHDDINQRIALVSINLERLQQDLSALAPAARKRLREIREQISKLGTDVQALSHDLHSSKLEYLGIVTAAKSYCKELSEKHVLEIEFHSEGVPENLPQDVALSLFRVLQEALQNAVKHSGSGHFEVGLRGTSNGIELSVRDAGMGFDLQEAMRSRGLGLISMQERIKLVKGELLVRSQLERGTTIHARVPLRSGGNAARTAA
jgi:signal transduction histidine kinase